MTSRAYGARNPRSYYDVILTVTSFATELSTPTVTGVRHVCNSRRGLLSSGHVRTDTLPRLINIVTTRLVFKIDLNQLSRVQTESVCDCDRRLRLEITSAVRRNCGTAGYRWW